MSEQQSAPTPEPWPEGVIARYLTVAGALVELTDGPDHITGTCTGCPKEAWPYPFSYDPTCSGFRMDSYVKRDATSWAQNHAGQCRALPRPAVTR